MHYYFYCFIKANYLLNFIMMKKNHNYPDGLSSRYTQKQNRLSSNLQDNYEDRTSQYHIKSTTSTNQYTNNKGSTDNLYAHKLQSMILDLQRQADQQQFQIQSLSEQSAFFMKTCQEQKQTIASFNIQSLKSQYEAEIAEMIAERQRVQQIIQQLRADYEEAFMIQQSQIQLKSEENKRLSIEINAQLDTKRDILSLLAKKDQRIKAYESKISEAEEQIDQLRNIQRKLTIAIKEIERMKDE